MIQKIWGSEARVRRAVILPQTYSYDREHKIIWQEALAGESFAKMAGTIGNLPEVTGEIGARLAALHAMRIDLPRRMTPAFHVRDLNAKLRAVTRAFPSYADRLRSLGHGLLGAVSRLDPEPITPIHASFKFSHIFQTPTGTAFIDFDGACLGDPAYDVGRFNAHLYRMMAKDRIDPPVAREAAARLCASYNRTARSPVRPERVSWFTVNHLITSELYKLVKRAGVGPVPRLIEVAESLYAV